MRVTHLFTKLACAALTCWSVLIAPPQIAAIDAEQSEPTQQAELLSEQKDLQDVGRFGANVTVGPGQTCKDLIVVLGSVTMDGTAQNDVVVVLGNLTINGEAEGDVVNILGTTKVGPNAKIRGDLVTVLGGQSVSPSARIDGERVDVSPGAFMPSLALGDYFHQGIGRARLLAPGLGWMWVLAGISLLLYLLLALVFPRPVANCAKVLETRPVASMIAGLLSFVLLGPLMLLMVVSLVGILVIPFIACGMVALLIFGKAAVYQYTGLQIGRQAKVEALQHPLLALAIGFVIFCLLYMVPILGFLVWGILIPLSFGCALLALFGGFKREHAEVKPTPIPPVPMPPEYPLPPAYDAQGQNAPPPPTTAMNAIIDPEMPPLASATPLTSAPPVATEMPKSMSDPGMPPLTSTLPPATETPPLTSTPPFTSTPPLTSNPGPSFTPPPFASPAAPPDVSHLEMAALPRATLLQRAGAVALDFLLMAIILTYLHVHFGWLLIWLGYHIAMWTWKGTTVGGVVMGLKVVRQSGRPIDAPVAAVRCLGSVLSTVALGLGFFRIAWKEDRLSWHDQIAGTMVVRVPKGVPLISV